MCIVTPDSGTFLHGTTPIEGVKGISIKAPLSHARFVATPSTANFGVTLYLTESWTVLAAMR
eukprot:7103419-Pyramimonas_sp.AAC.1